MIITDPQLVLNNLSAVMKALTGQGGLIVWLAGLMGVFFVVSGFVNLKNGAENPHHNNGNAVSLIIVGILLVNFWSAQRAISDSLQLYGGLFSPQLAGSSYLAQSWSAIKEILYGIGVIGVFRGFLLLKSIGDGGHGQSGSSSWTAFWNILGGVILMKL